jgi:hypothetical protein
VTKHAAPLGHGVSSVTHIVFMLTLLSEEGIAFRGKSCNKLESFYFCWRTYTATFLYFHFLLEHAADTVCCMSVPHVLVKCTTVNIMCSLTVFKDGAGSVFLWLAELPHI